MNDGWTEDMYRGKEKFQTGDMVRLKNGSTKIEVMFTTTNYGSINVEGRYVKTGSRVFKDQRRFVLWDEQLSTEKESPMKGKLYQTIDTNPTRFGIGLATNSKGEYVLEMKDTGGVEAFAPSMVETVMPYTFRVAYFDTSKTYDYLGVEGCVKVGDVLLPTSNETINGRPNVCIVMAVNTKNETATRHFTGVKLLTETIDTAGN